MPPPVRPATLRELLEEPFGPYWEESVLSPACPGTTPNHPVALRCLILDGGGTYTGLNECELTQPEYDAARFDSTPPRFRAVLEIKHLSWLTDDARTSIEQELRDRDVRARSVGGRQAGASTITLKNIYGPTPGFQGGQLRVKVLIQSIKHLPAVYLASNYGPETLVISSQLKEGKARRWRVDTMHFYTYRLSIDYLARFRVLQVLKALLALDAGANNHQANTTPTHLRTPDWYVGLYMKHMAYSGGARKHRPAYASSDSDIEPGSNGSMQRPREHALRHVPRAEIRAHFAAHAEWLIAEVKKMSYDKLFDVDVWHMWLVDHRRRGGQAWRPGARRPAEASLDDDDDDDDLLPLPPKPRRGKKSGPQRRSTGTRTSSRTSTTTRRSTGSPATGGPSLYTPPPPPPIDDTRLRTYDSDFSPVSTPPGSPSSSSSGLPSRGASPVDPALASLIPSAFCHAPQPTATFRWACPEPGCTHMLDLLRLSDADLDVPQLSEDDRRRLRGRDWSGREEWVREAFYYMVDKHWCAHLDERGVKAEFAGGRWKLGFKYRSDTHPQSGQLRKVKEDNRRPVVKQEDY